MEGKHRDTSNSKASPVTANASYSVQFLLPRSIPENPAPKYAIPTSQHRQTMLYWSHWKARTPSGGCLPNSTGLGRNTGMKGACV